MNYIVFLSSPGSEDVGISPDPDVPSTAAPSSETPVAEILDIAATEQELPPVEKEIVIPLEKEEEEPVSSTITLLDGEEEVDEEDEDKTDQHRQQQERLNYCFLFPSVSYPCSCAESLQEYLYQQSLALLSKKRKCQTAHRKPMIPSLQTPTWHLSPSPSACPEPQLHHSEVHQPHEKQQASGGEPGSGASPAKTLQPPGNTVEFNEESISEPPVLETSQTSNLPLPSATDSSSAKPTAVLETPQLSSEELDKEAGPEKSQDVQIVEHIELSASLSSSTDVKPIVSATDVSSSVASTEEEPNTDSQLENHTPVEIPDKTDQSQVFPADPHLDQRLDLSAAPESTKAPTEMPHPAVDTELEHSGAPTIVTETKTEDFTEDLLASSGGNNQLLQPSPLAPPSSPSLSDIYAETPSGSEQNGNLVHGSSQKESVFMRLNNRIKALEMNMSLSGRYLEQLSQR